ncbi:MAG: S8 family peptidase [Bacteroides sp.]|nr:S8 family peptidase [Bacteroides sp.]
MNKFLLSAIISLSVAPAFSQSKISVDGQAFMNQYRVNKASTMKAMGLDTQAVPTVSVIAMIADGYTADDIRAAGYEVETDFGISAIVNVSIEQVEALSELPSISSLTFGGTKQAKMDLGRAATGVDEAHNGIDVNGVTHKFTGKGVMVGMYDTGLDANHLTFRKDDLTTSRINRLWHYRNSYNTVPTTYTAATIKNFTTDTQSETHATHVASIMCGSYKGNGNFAYTPDAAADNMKHMYDTPIPYYGVAIEAEPVFAVGYLGDPMILHGVEKIVSQAESYGQPCVVNLSLGSNLGSHDGTDEYTATLDELGKRAIICMSAGNEAEMDMSLKKRFTTGDLTVKTFLEPATDMQVTSLDMPIDVWSGDTTPVTVTMFTYRKSDGAITQVVTNSAKSVSFTTRSGMSSGSGQLSCGIDAASNRYYVRISPSQAIKISSNYYLMITVTGQNGKEMRMYYGGYGNFKSNNIEGFTAGNADESINTSAVTDNIISVGSFTTRQAFGILGDNKYSYISAGLTPGTVSSFSSYGTTLDGRPLPTVLAPGSTIIAGFSQYYFKTAYGGDTDYATGYTTYGTTNHYWGPLDGTSMSSPFAAGVIALWLEADPTLTVQDVKAIIAETSVTDSFTKAKSKAAGAGKINAAAGLRKILGSNSAIGTINDNTSRLLVTRTENGFDIVLGGEARFNAQLVDMQGRTVASAEGNDAHAFLATDGLNNGVYVLTVQGNGVAESHKVTIR